MASSLKDEQDRIRGLLLDTVTLLCRNGLTFKKKLKVQGLLGITLDEENVFIVHFDESLGEVVVDMQDKCSTSTAESDSVRPATANDRTERKSEKKRKATTAELGEPSEKVHIKSEDNDDVVCLEEQPDVKPVPMQALPSYPAEGMYGTYGQLPMSQPPQIMPPVMNANNVSSLPPSVLQTPSSLNTHGLTAYSDGSAITQQMTPEKVGSLLLGAPIEIRTQPKYPPRSSENYQYRMRQPRRPRVPGMKKFVCNAAGCQRRYYERRHLLEHQYLKHGRPRPCRDAPGKLSVWLPTGARRQIEPTEYVDPDAYGDPDSVAAETLRNSSELLNYLDNNGLQSNTDDENTEATNQNSFMTSHESSPAVFNESIPVFMEPVAVLLNNESQPE